MGFEYYLPVNLVFGRGSLWKVGYYCANYGKKALIVTGENSTRQSGVLDRVVHYLNSAQVDSVVFDKVKQNPLTTTAIEAAHFAKENGCDIVLGVGGGSIMDCAKAAAFLAVNKGDINDYIYNKKKSDHALPIILVPTTCGTGSEGNGFAVLTNPENGDKKSLRCNAIIAKVSIIDSECMVTMPKKVLASVGFDAFCHCMEAYISKKSQPIINMMCEKGMKLIGDNLVSIYKEDSDPMAWDGVALASTLGGMSINCAGVTVAHGMEHPASGLKNIVHGKGLAALTPVVMEASYSECTDKFAVISKCLGGNNEHDCVDRIRRLLEQLRLDIGLRDLGITEEDLGWMTKNCMKVSAAGLECHPVSFSEAQIYKMYEKAL